jgi:hypothetical protein
LAGNYFGAIKRNWRENYLGKKLFGRENEIGGKVTLVEKLIWAGK